MQISFSELPLPTLSLWLSKVAIGKFKSHFTIGLNLNSNAVLPLGHKMLCPTVCASVCECVCVNQIRAVSLSGWKSVFLIWKICTCGALCNYLYKHATRQAKCWIELTYNNPVTTRHKVACQQQPRKTTKNKKKEKLKTNYVELKLKQETEQKLRHKLHDFNVLFCMC